MMRHIGEQLLKSLGQFTDRWIKLTETTTTFEVDGNLIVVSVAINGDDPLHLLNAFVEEKRPSAITALH